MKATVQWKHISDRREREKTEGFYVNIGAIVIGMFNLLACFADERRPF
jgi:hypothetical protein